ncbi:hypothetical protein BASA50_000963 [Batrachochytrium salamandrivorans]|uniref:Uncharacterized protein n=1 Tax=Batrachochytrium salamandrivorans TaxID=1357716 RepID=A0ABQ8ESZ5_9FUNG|nr:hypothetical protein BASA50_000963 [Batrachochytrium salamandrivorans]
MQFTTVFIASITAIVTVNAAVLPVVNDNAEQSNVLESRSYNAPTDDTNLEKRSPQYGGNGYQQQNWGNQWWGQGGNQQWNQGGNQQWDPRRNQGGNQGWYPGQNQRQNQQWGPWSGSGQSPIPNRRRY